MKKYFSKGLSILFIILLMYLLTNNHNRMKEAETLIRQNVISAKYEDGFIVAELEGEIEKCSSVERYDISLVTIKSIEEEKSYIKKYFNGYGKLIDVILFYNGDILKK